MDNMEKMKDYSPVIKGVAFVSLVFNILTTIFATVFLAKSKNSVLFGMHSSSADKAGAILIIGVTVVCGLITSFILFALLIGWAQIVNNSEVQARVALKEEKTIETTD